MQLASRMANAAESGNVGLDTNGSINNTMGSLDLLEYGLSDEDYRIHEHSIKHR